MLTFLAYILPLLLCAAYAVTAPLIPAGHQAWFNSEYGPVENLTALAFLAVGIVAAGLLWKLRRRATDTPKLWRLWYLLLALGGVFVFLEEISYGQHIFGWQAPQYFLEHAKQPETNLHNLHGDLLARLLRRIAEIGFPIMGLIVPAVFVFAKVPYRRGTWAWYAMPRLELALWLVAAALIRPARNWTSLERLSEFQELLWAGAILTYVLVIARRLLREPAPPQALPAGAAGGGHH